jgi:S1-C subfamily serine protease
VTPRAPAAAWAVAAVAALGLGGCGEAPSTSAPGTPVPLVTRADVVAVHMLPGAGGAEATGVRVGRGRVLTVAHALPASARPGRATVARTGWPPRRARLTARDDVADLAVLTTDRVAVVPVGPGAAPAPGPRDRTPAPAPAAQGGTDRGWRVLLRREGRVVDRAAPLRRPISASVAAPGSGTGGRRPTLELALRAEPGDSGAPVIDRRGRLVGVLFAVSEDRAGTAYAVTAAPAVPLLRTATGG